MTSYPLSASCPQKALLPLQQAGKGSLPNLGRLCLAVPRVMTPEQSHKFPCDNVGVSITRLRGCSAPLLTSSLHSHRAKEPAANHSTQETSGASQPPTGWMTGLGWVQSLHRKLCPSISYSLFSAPEHPRLTEPLHSVLCKPLQVRCTHCALPCEDFPPLIDPVTSNKSRGGRKHLL